MENNKGEERGVIKDREVVLKEIEIKTNPHNPEQIDKIIFSTDGGNITWKPKYTKSSYEGGIKITSTVPMEKGVLPPKLLELARAISDQGQIRVKACYEYWKTMADGQPVTYRYIRSTKALETWEIIKDTVQTENILP